MKIRMKTSMQGPTVSLRRGDEVEFHDAEADRLIAAGIAEAVDPAASRAAPLERAVSAPAGVETAVATSPARRRKAG